MCKNQRQIAKKCVVTVDSFPFCHEHMASNVRIAVLPIDLAVMFHFDLMWVFFFLFQASEYS